MENEYSTRVIDFWKANPSYWIPIHTKIRNKADEEICQTFGKAFDYKLETLVGQIIYLDQFSRHFQRKGILSEEDVELNRKKAIYLVKSNLLHLEKMDEVELVFTLMPFKHVHDYSFIFHFIHRTWLKIKEKDLLDYPLLHKFYMDTYKKAYTEESVKKCIINHHPLLHYDKEICDYYPDEYEKDFWAKEFPLTKGSCSEKLSKFLPLAKEKGQVAVSLSGGVDSMVLLYLLVQQKANPVAIHIVYGNRYNSEEEYKFISEFCHKLSVPLYVYKIEWLKRGEVDRKFYEEMTRDLRFFVYKAVGLPVCLGHIQDDVVENIWTNFATGKNLHTLKKMEKEEIQHDICILRPFIKAEKKDIYQVSNEFGIPYLKNTTPSWSNRGKFREHFHSHTLAQFGEGVDKKVIEVAEALEQQNIMLVKLLYKPIFDSFEFEKDYVRVNITPAIQAELDSSGWAFIFERLCHRYFHCPKPSIHSIRNFCERLEKIKEFKGKDIHVHMNKYFGVCVKSTNFKIYLYFEKKEIS